MVKIMTEDQIPCKKDSKAPGCSDYPCKKDSKAPGCEPSEPSPLLQLDDGTTPPDTGNTASFKAADEGIEGGGTSPSDTNTVNDDGNTSFRHRYR